MYKIKILNFEKKYLLEELIKIFLRPDQYRILSDEEDAGDADFVFNEENFSDRNQIKRRIYDCLSKETGQTPEWGILTGIRPVKLIGEYYESVGKDRAKSVRKLTEYYYLTEEKANLIMDMYLHQMREIGPAKENSAGVYIGIPFCPTRCVYCSFASNQVPDEEIARYLTALHKEVEYAGRRMRECKIKAESIYIGGGTPTTLNAEQLKALIEKIKESFDMTEVLEFTVEAGRPDTITKEKLAVLKDCGIDRISINPQSMKAHTLKLIGRNHKPEDIIHAFKLAREAGISNINADVIAGLPEESREDFSNTIREVLALKPESITVHCLAVKRASKLKEKDENFHYKQAERVSIMLSDSREIMAEEGYLPYYLYRQKHMAGAYENIGYAKPGKDCIYNVRIMDEHQTIVALGAGGITKVYFPGENRLERVPNVTNYQEYISRIDEMLERKEINFFREVKKWQ